MLKWAVNGSRQTYLQNRNNNMEIPLSPSSSSQQRRISLKRKSSDLSALETKATWHDRENQYTSTPLHKSYIRFLESPSSKTSSLKDLSNITPEVLLNLQQMPLERSVSPKTLETPESTQTRRNLPNNYASTLPTFDVEYSPCAFIPGPMLALRGVGIPDSYFEKPRYLTHRLKESLYSVNEEISLETKTFMKSNKSVLKYPPPYVEGSTLSSSKMGDTTLEHMIDAILDSNRKDRKPPKAPKQSNMSATYTPAEDPASDLNEVWDSQNSRCRQKELKFRAKLTKKILFNEKEVHSPLLQENCKTGQLKRQRGLRRKRQISQNSENNVSSVEKVLGKCAEAQTFCTCSHNLNKVFDTILVQNVQKIHPCKVWRNLSPDSGHNSSSDFEEENTNSTLEYRADNTKTFDNMKRKSSFSLQNINQT